MAGRLGRRLRRGLNPRFSGIRFRLALALAGALLPILVLGAFQAREAFVQQTRDQREDVILAADRAAEGARARIDASAALLQVLAPDPYDADCGPRLAQLRARLPGYDAFFRYDARGRLVCSSEPAPGALAAAFGGGEGFARLRAGESLTLTRAPAELAGRPALVAAVRAERTGGFDGALAAVVALDDLQPDIDDPALPRGTEAALTDAQGRLLVATDPAAFDLGDGAALAGWVDRARASASPLFQASDRQGRERIYAGAALAGRDVYVLLSAPERSLWSWARLNPIGAMLVPLLAFFAALIAVLAVTERVVIRWLEYLERIAAIYARGRFTVRPVKALRAPSEIRVLARALDDLADAIVSRDRSLNDSLAEKDGLMREIHHRVKNNLQIISSLLSMQQRALTDPPAKAALGDTRQRISALALIYRTLYQSTDVRVADSRAFLTELVGQLVAAEAARGPLVTSSVEADSLFVDPDKLAPLALWLVEAVSNAHKHAFAGRGGDLKVRFRVDGERATLEVEDDGPGVPPHQDRPGVGQTLMTAFARQLRGEMETTPAPGGGAVARMTFLTPEAETPIDPADVAGTGGRPRR